MGSRHIQKPDHMKKKQKFRVLIITALAAGIVCFVWASTGKSHESTCSKESMEECSKHGKCTEHSSWESLPHQFFSTIAL